MRLMIFDCEDDEAAVFRELSPRFHMEPVITKLSVTQHFNGRHGGGALSDRLPPGVKHHDRLLSVQHGGEPSFGSRTESQIRCISVAHRSRITASDLAALHAAGVSCIAARSIGTDHIDADAAARLGIAIRNAAYRPDGVADYTLMLILMAIRGIRSVLLGAAHGDFSLSPTRGKELSGMTVGIVGAGRIGRAVKERLSGFGCRILLCDPNGGTDCIPLHGLLRESDIVTLHVPLLAETRHMIGKEELGLMKRGAYFINTGRGALVDTEALVCALESGCLGGAALDVLEGEEGIFYFDHSQHPANHPFLTQLLAMPNVIVTPHTAFHTERALYDTVEKTLQNCLDHERRFHHE